LHWLSRHQTSVLLVALVAAVWGALFVTYDYRSPISQFLRGVGTVQLEGWSAYDLDSLCIRLEATPDVPRTTVENAIEVARKAFPDGDIREILFVSLRDTCNGTTAPRPAWVVAMTQAGVDPAALLNGESPARAIVLIDAATGVEIARHGW
jgi:hypothetical protein